MDKNTLFIGLAIVVAVIAGGYINKPEVIAVNPVVVTQEVPRTQEQSNSLGAISGPDVYSYFNVHGALTGKKFTQGGTVLPFTATSTQDARTLTEAEMLANSVIEIVSTSSPALTLTLPATSTMTTLIPTAGDSMVWFLTNKHAAATTTTIAAGTGIILDEPDGQNVVIAGGNRARIECFRDSSTDVVCSVDENIDAD